MILMVLGLLVWSGAHLFRRLAPDARARLGEPGKGVVAVLSLVAIVLMVIGYRGWDSAQVWFPPAAMTHINNLLVLLAVYLFAASGMKTAATRVIRHPQLTAVLLWAAGHLLVNGDLASIVLFGGLAVWALVEMLLINRDTVWVKNPPASMGKEIGAIVGAVVVTGILGYIHTFFGLLPFGA